MASQEWKLPLAEAIGRRALWECPLEKPIDVPFPPSSQRHAVGDSPWGGLLSEASEQCGTHQGCFNIIPEKNSTQESFIAGCPGGVSEAGMQTSVLGALDGILFENLQELGLFPPVFGWLYNTAVRGHCVYDNVL